MTALRAIVVVPARDEQQRIADAVDAILRQAASVGACFGVIVVDDGSRDETRTVAERALAAATSLGIPYRLVDGPAAGVGWARRVGLDAAALWALSDDPAAGRECLLVSSDADTIVDEQWLAKLLACARAGHPVIAGDVRLDPGQPLDPDVQQRRQRAATRRLTSIREHEPDAAHHHFAAANLALTVAAYEAVGGMPTVTALEDEALLEAVRRVGLPVHRTAAAVVRTSPRTTGRAGRGLANDLAVETWRTRSRHHHRDFPIAGLPRTGRVSVVLPAKQVAATIAGVLSRTVGPLLEAGLVDELVVIDAASTDGTAEIAAAHGARVVQQDEIRAELGRCQGKGDAMWRALQVTDGEIVAFLDADTADPSPAHLAGILGPLLTDDAVAMVRGCFDRPYRGRDGALEPHAGGRVTELVARPLLNLHLPALAGFRQPLAGEFAARRSLLSQLPFPVGYGVEIATLIDAVRLVGLDAVAEVDLGSRQNRHQPLRDLTPMAYAVLCAVERRLARGGPIAGALRLPWQDDLPLAVPIAERPPLGVDAPEDDDEPARRRVSA